MNSCEYYQELISRLVDGEISHDEYEALMAHMESCSRCSAMYAVFHDLSDVLAGEAEEPLPEGLHENIMAGVRRSAIEKKNRRMRSIGLRTALTAAACAVLVIFAALGFAPHERAEEVTIKREQAAEQVLADRAAPAPEPAQTSAPEAPASQQAAAPTAASGPAESAAPKPKTESAVSAPAAPAAEEEDSYLAAGSTSDQARDLELAAAPAAQDDAPAVDLDTAAAAPASEERREIPAETETTAGGESVTIESAAQGAAPAAPAVQNAAPAEPAAESAESAEPAAAESPAPAGETSKPSLFSGLSSLFHAAAPDAASAPETASAPEGEAASEKTGGTPSPRPEKKDEQPDSYSIRKKEQFTALLALLGEKEEKLPDAALTRSIRVSYLPEDVYGGGEKLEILLYDDFVYYTRTRADGSSLSCRADCSVSALEDYLSALTSDGPAAAPTPTADPFAAAPAASFAAAPAAVPAAEDLVIAGQH